MGSTFAAIVMIAWIPLVLALFMTTKPLTAVLSAFIGAWLFLPMIGYKLTAGLPIYDKMSATAFAVLIGVVVFDFGRLRQFSFRLADLPMLIWCLCPFASSIANGQGAYDGASATLRQVLTWGLPYFIGRLYFTSADDLVTLARAIFVGAVIYVPLCLWEIRMSPQLHAIFYGVAQHDFGQTIRFGGYRPMVFMQHGLMVGMWMCMASLIGIWLWQARASNERRYWLPSWMILPLLLTAILCKSTGAIILMLTGLGVLQLCSWTKTALPLWCLIAIAPLALTLRISGISSGDSVVSISNNLFGADRAQSLKFRLDNEDALAAKALQHLMFGWGTWGDALIKDDAGQDLSVTDGLWIIALGDHGIVGLGALTFALLMPAILVCLRLPVAGWSTPLGAAVAALAVVTTLSMIDNIPNAMVNPIFTLAVGGITGLVTKAFKPARSASGQFSRGINVRLVGVVAVPHLQD